MKCRHCFSKLTNLFLDLGIAPPSNNYLKSIGVSVDESKYPLKLFVCNDCWLVQTEDFSEPKDLFASDYAYFSSTSKSWLHHTAQYSKMAIKDFGLNSNSFVIEIAANDGYLLKNFVNEGIPCLGIEPTVNTANAAEKLGVTVLREFFSSNVASKLMEDGKQADLICGNNVYAHVPDINDFTKALKICLKNDGVVTLEFPHLMQLIKGNQFDTVYHEHYSYFSLTTVSTIFKAFGLRLFKVEELSTHGGSLRIYGCHESGQKKEDVSVKNILAKEESFGINKLDVYSTFQLKADKVKNDFVDFLLQQKKIGKTIAGYGAAAKGNTLINYSNVKTDLIDFICDAALSKQGKYMPGSHIPIYPPDELKRRKPDWVFIFPWNIAEEIQTQENPSAWGGKFVVAIPELRILS
jgi:hypothetical protein